MSARDEQFAAFVRADRRALVRFATTLTAGDAHLAEDLVQTALVRVYLADPSGPGSLHGYVRRAVVNALIDHRRRPFTRRERAASEVPERPATTPVDGVDPELVAALAALPIRMRAAVVLRHVEGLSVEETADALRCSTGTVKSQTSRGIDKLRTLLAPTPTPVTNPRPLVTPGAAVREGELPCPTS